MQDRLRRTLLCVTAAKGAANVSNKGSQVSSLSTGYLIQIRLTSVCDAAHSIVCIKTRVSQTRKTPELQSKEAALVTLAFDMKNPKELIHTALLNTDH